MQADAQNADFWNYVCGSNARAGRTIEDFDAWFFRQYPWIERWVPFDDMAGKDVIEVGIGSGTTARRIAQVANLTALDVAPQPLLALKKETVAPVTTVEGSILDAPFETATFDYCVSIGCIHHTGDAALALREICRVTRPGGGLSIMVYHSGSRRRMDCWDHDGRGRGAPITAWFSVDEVSDMIRAAGYSRWETGIEHFVDRGPGGLSVYASAVK